MKNVISLKEKKRKSFSLPKKVTSVAKSPNTFIAICSFAIPAIMYGAATDNASIYIGASVIAISSIWYAILYDDKKGDDE